MKKVLCEGVEFTVSFTSADGKYYEFEERPGELFLVSRCLEESDENLHGRRLSRRTSNTE